MFYALQQYGIETGLKEDLINQVNDYFKPIKQKYVDNGMINPKSLATDAQALVYKVPGGMLSNMIANLTDMKAMDKFDQALAEIPAVRKDLGYPPLVTPLSQMVGNQAVTNVLLGERYKQISRKLRTISRANTALLRLQSQRNCRKKYWEQAESQWIAGLKTRSGLALNSGSCGSTGRFGTFGRRCYELYLLSGSDFEIPEGSEGTGRKRSHLYD